MGELRSSGGYRETASFQAATVVYDGTYSFCAKFLDPHSRTVDQMVQAARSGRQHIAQGSRAAASSLQSELRLFSVARSSLEELLLDFEDYLRLRRLRQWAPDSPDALTVRRVARAFRKDPTDPSDQSDEKLLKDEDCRALYARWLEHDDPVVRANALICLINQANYLLDRQIGALEKRFVEEGGHNGQLAGAGTAGRETKRPGPTDGTGPSDRPDHSSPCPLCGSPMVLRTAKTGKSAGRQFWGCSAYPECKGNVKRG